MQQCKHGGSVVGELSVLRVMKSEEEQVEESL